MKLPSPPLTLLLLGILPAAAQLAPALPDAARTAPVPETPTIVAEAPAADAQPAEPLSEAEQRLRRGIVMLGQLHDLLSRIRDAESAEAAVAPIMRASAEFQTWAQGLSSLPPLDDETRYLYESRYLPIIDEINTRIRIQGERIASAEFYASKNLPAALVRLVTAMQ